MDCVVDQLMIRVGIMPKKGDFGAVLNWQQNIGCRMQCCFPPSRPEYVGLLCQELIQNINYTHFCMPSLDSGIGQHLKRIIDAGIKCSEACVFDVPN